jgi:hypothetical protein
LDPDAPLIVAEAVWQYSHHVLPGLTTHRGPILTVANWSGTWPGLVGMLNLNGSLTKAGVEYSTLWSEDFRDAYFRRRLRQWLRTGRCSHQTDHVVPLRAARIGAARRTGETLAGNCARRRRSSACLTKAAWGCSTRSSRTICSMPPACSRNG